MSPVGRTNVRQRSGIRASKERMGIAQHNRKSRRRRLEQSACLAVSRVGGMPDARLHFFKSGLAKSPCRGFATRNLTGAGMPTPVFFHRART